MAISRLARFHAVSFAMRNEKDLDMVTAYPFLSEDPVYRPDTKELFLKTQANIVTRLLNIFQQESSAEFKRSTFKNVGFFANSGVNNSKLLSLSDVKPRALATQSPSPV